MKFKIKKKNKSDLPSLYGLLYGIDCSHLEVTTRPVRVQEGDSVTQ